MSPALTTLGLLTAMPAQSKGPVNIKEKAIKAELAPGTKKAETGKTANLAQPEPSGLSKAKATLPFWLGLGLITLVAAFLRLWQLGDFPQQFNEDEMVLGYDSWSLWLTDRDHHGDFLPIHFQTYNDFVPPLANYIASPFTGLLGLTEFSTRLPTALLGILTVFLSGLLGRRLFGPVAGLITAGLLTLEPWHVSYSRIAFPGSLVPFFTVCALYFFVKAIAELENPKGYRRRAGINLLFSGLSFGLLFMTYPIEKVNAPVLFLLCFGAVARLLWKNKALLVTWVSAAIVAGSPVAIEQLLSWNESQSRFNAISVFKKPEWWFAQPRNYLAHYNPSQLFFEGYLTGFGVRPFGVGQLLWLEALLLIVASLALLGLKPHNGLSRRFLLMGWLITFPLAASFTILTPNETRALNFLPLPELLSGFGAVKLWQYFSNFKKVRWQKLARWGFAVAGGLLVLVNAWLFLLNFFPDKARILDRPADKRYYNLGFPAVAQEAARRLQPCDSLWLDDFNQSYMYYIFSTDYPPARFQKDVKQIGTLKGGYIHVENFGQVIMGNPRAKYPRVPPENLKNCANPDAGEIYWLTQWLPDRWPETRLEWKRVQIITNSKGQPVWSLLQKV